MPMRINLTGRTFGHWTVLGVGRYEKRQRFWRVRCVCGAEHERASTMLRAGKSKSCGCMKSALVIAAQTTHGMSRSPLYLTWQGMRGRCLNPSNTVYRHYGGRGIAICERWNDFAAFKEDMGPTWFHHATLERDDVNGPYDPKNCRWVRQAVQPTNMRSNVHIETPWGVLTLSEAARRIGCSNHALRHRISRGWTVPELFSPPRRTGTAVNPHRRIYLATPEGNVTVQEAATRLGVHSSTVHSRLRQGWTSERLFAHYGR